MAGEATELAIGVRMPAVQLVTGVRMPAVQLGTFRTRGAAVSIAVEAALRAGYSAIDTAAVYRNHREIAASLRRLLPELGLARSDIFLTSKLSPADQGGERAGGAIELALSELDTDYLDLFLIHWPGTQGLDVADPDNSRLREESWRVLEEFFAAGKLRAIGVSNYTVRHLQELLAVCSVVPHVNQVELHPHYPQEELVSFCHQHNIHVQAYSSLGQSGPKSPLLVDPTVLEISKQSGKSPAQILLGWGLQLGFSVLPKSTNPQHIQENFDLSFRLSASDMSALNQLHHGSSGRKYAWDPTPVL